MTGAEKIFLILYPEDCYVKMLVDFSARKRQVSFKRIVPQTYLLRRLFRMHLIRAAGFGSARGC